jgi:hypothetical protein
MANFGNVTKQISEHFGANNISVAQMPMFGFLFLVLLD